MELPVGGMTCLEFIAALMGYLAPVVGAAVGISYAGDVVKIGYEWAVKGGKRHVG